MHCGEPRCIYVASAASWKHTFIAREDRTHGWLIMWSIKISRNTDLFVFHYKSNHLFSCSRHGGRDYARRSHCVSFACVCAALADFCRHLSEKIFGNFPIIDLDKSIIIRASLCSLLHVRSAWRSLKKRAQQPATKSDAIYGEQFATRRKWYASRPKWAERWVSNSRKRACFGQRSILDCTSWDLGICGTHGPWQLQVCFLHGTPTSNAAAHFLPSLKKQQCVFGSYF